ncbi:MAG: glycosyltransferase family 9 protein [Cytophagales bacterium]
MNKKLLVYRFSALGDVVMTYPVLMAVLNTNPELEIVFVTRKRFGDLFKGIDRLKVIELDFDEDYKGFWGLIKLFLKLKSLKPFAVADLHLILRTRILDALFSLFFFKVKAIEKERRAKKRLVNKNHKILKSLSHTTERYLNVFKALGLNVPNALPKILFKSNNEDLEKKLLKYLDDKMLLPKKKIWIGIAPFAQHENKMWGLEKVENLVKMLVDSELYEIFLFGGGKKEKKLLDHLAKNIKHSIHNVTGEFSLSEEMILMKKLDKMLAMDSGNMHMACLAGTEVFSIWGATHPFAGFSPLYQNENNIISEELPCRPCSVFGDKVCHRGDKACMNLISAERVFALLK